MNKILAAVVVIILVLLGWFLFMGRTAAPTEVDTGVENQMPVQGSEEVSERVVEIELGAINFKFSENSITVAKGDTVRLTLNNTQGMHDLKIDEFAVGTKVLQAGQSETIEFVADRAGAFEYYCSVGTHREQGMVGTLIVN